MRESREMGKPQLREERVNTPSLRSNQAKPSIGWSDTCGERTLADTQRPCQLFASHGQTQRKKEQTSPLTSFFK